MTPDEIGNAIRAFRSRNCPACGTEKINRSDPFCEPCVDRLPSHLQEGVIIHSKFIENFGPALRYLRDDGSPPKDRPRANAANGRGSKVRRSVQKKDPITSSKARNK